MKIYSIRWFDKGGKYKYSLKDPLKAKFWFLGSSILEKTMITIAEYDYSVTDGVLREINTGHDFIDNAIRTDTICYNLEVHSISWWVFFEDFVIPNKMKCPRR